MQAGESFSQDSTTASESFDLSQTSTTESVDSGRLQSMPEQDKNADNDDDAAASDATKITIHRKPRSTAGKRKLFDDHPEVFL